MTRKVETKKKEVNSDEWLKGTYYNQVLSISSAVLVSEAHDVGWWYAQGCQHVSGIRGQASDMSCVTIIDIHLCRAEMVSQMG